MDVAAWLQGLGLERYVPAFRDNEIDWEVLPKLTSEDLREIGITAIGHRRKLLDAVAALGAAVPAAAVTAPGAPAQVDAERRQLTVAFCDLVGSTALSARFDPEDLRELIGAYHHAVAAAVAGFDGFVAKYMGDGVLIYFGYPQAHEDDAERAVRAGLGIIDAVARLDVQSVKLQARVGIATGLVVVGDLIGEGSAQEQSVVGETPNLAARLQTLAEPDAVVIAAGTRRLVGDLFEYRDLGTVEVKGIAAPVPAWQVLRQSVVASRFEALHASSMIPLVGRDEEMELLLRRWARAKDGAGQVVLLSGEPGIGKSRIAAALQDRLRGESHIGLRYFGSPHHRDSPLHPFIAHLEETAGIAREDLPETRLAKLQGLLLQSEQSATETFALLADLLDLPIEGGDLAPAVESQRKRALTFRALLQQLDRLTRREPVLVLFEDVHWIDPTSRDLLGQIVEQAPRLSARSPAARRLRLQACTGPGCGVFDVAAVAQAGAARAHRRGARTWAGHRTGDAGAPFRGGRGGGKGRSQLAGSRSARAPAFGQYRSNRPSDKGHRRAHRDTQKRSDRPERAANAAVPRPRAVGDAWVERP